MTWETLGWTFSLGTPQALALLAIGLPLLALASWRSATDQAPARRALHLALRVGALAALALALADPRLVRQERAVSVVVLADVSASLGDKQLEETRRVVTALGQAAATAEPTPAAVRVLRFAGRAEALAAPAVPLTRFPGDDGLETDLAAALGLGLGLLDPDRVPRLLVVSDGRATRGDLGPAVARARERGVRVFVHAPQADLAPDAAVVGLSAPPSVRPRAPFDLEVELRSTTARAARLRLRRDGRPHEPEATRAVALVPGRTTVRWSTRLDEDAPALYEVALDPDPTDAQPGNDRAVLAVAPLPKPRVLVVEGVRDAGRSFARALAAEQIETTVLGTRAVPDRPALDPFDLVVLADVPRHGLRPGAVAALEAHVREGGGGLLVALGPQTVGSGGHGEGRLDALLPLRQDDTAEKEEPSLALALVIDRSGSMSGPKMELTKEAARGTAEMMAPEDLISVVVFDSQAHTVVRLQPASNRQRILGDIAQIRASGGTNILPGLREAVEPLMTARAKKKHVIVLSDGQSPVEGLQELIDEAASARITISAVGVGEGADLAVLQTIAARGGGRFYNARDPASIPRIFSRETAQFSRPSYEEQSTAAVVQKRAELLGGIPIDRAPPLRGHTRTRPKKDAEVLLATDTGDPLLARWQVGLGQVAVWASDLGGRWAGDWARWREFPKLWSQASRSLMRRQAGTQIPLAVTARPGRATVTWDLRGSDDRPLPGLEASLRAVAVRPGPDGAAARDAERRVVMTELAPGLHEAQLPVEPGEALLLEAELRDPETGKVHARGHGRVAAPVAPELLPELPTRDETPQGRATLEALAAETGGAAWSTPAALLDPGADAVLATRPLRHPFVWLALSLFLAELALRRVRLRASRTAGRGAAW